MGAESRRNLLILSFTLLVVMLGYGMAMPMLPFYAAQFGVGGKEFGWMMASYSFMQLVCAPLWGAASDRVGRKPILAAGVLGYGLAFLLFGLARSFAALFIARSLSGVLSSAAMPTAMAYIGDNTRPEEKSQAMGQLGATVGLGTILGPLLGGLLSGGSLALPFFAGAGLAFAAFLLVLALLPGGRAAAGAPAGQGEGKAGGRAGEGAGESPATEGTKTEGGGSGRKTAMWLQAMSGPAGMLLALVLIMSFGLANFQNLIGLFVLEKFALDSRKVSTLWAVMGATLLGVQGLLTGPLAKRMGEMRLIRLGLLGGAAGFVLVAQARDYGSTLLTLGLFIGSLALIGPALNAHLSRYAGERQGALMGLNSAAASLGKVLGPLWGGSLFDLDMHYPFYSGALALLAGWGISLAAGRKGAGTAG